MFYAASVWLTPPSVDFRLSRGITKKLGSVQRRCAILITGAMPSTAADTLDAHANLLPLPLLVSKICFREISRLSCLPPPHPLHKVILRSSRFIKHHRSPLHLSIHILNIIPSHLETIQPIPHPPKWQSEIKIKIPKDKKAAKIEANRINSTYVVYTDGSGYQGGIGAAAEIYKNGELVQSSKYHLGSDFEHTVFEGELVGILMGLGLILQVNTSDLTVIGVDSQAAIRATSNSTTGSGSYILTAIHNRMQHIRSLHPRIRITIQWVPGHVGIRGNEQVDLTAKSAAVGNSDLSEPLPLPLITSNHNRLPISKSALSASFNIALKQKAKSDLAESPRYRRMMEVDPSLPSPNFLKLITGLTRKQATILFQLRSGHAPLNKHLHRIGKSTTPISPRCKRQEETTLHFLLLCPSLETQRCVLTQKFGHRARSMSYLLSSPKAIPTVLRYIKATKRFPTILGPSNPPPPPVSPTASPTAPPPTPLYPTPRQTALPSQPGTL